MNVKLPYVNSPVCGKKLEHYSKSQLNDAIRKNRKCISCSKRGINHPLFGKHHSDNTKNKLSLGKIGSKILILEKWFMIKWMCNVHGNKKETIYRSY